MSTSIGLTHRVRITAPAVVLFGSFAVVALALSFPVPPFDTHGYRSGTTIYPIGTWILVVGGLIAGASSLLADPWIKQAAAGVALVAAMQLVGLAIVAHKHWEPAFGMGGGYGNGYGSLGTLKAMAVVIASAGVIGGAAGIWQLAAERGFSRQHAWVRVTSVLVGIGAMVVLPLVITNGNYGADDLTSWGAVGLIYAGPWGSSIIGSGWLTRPAAFAVLASVCVSIMLAAIGPQMTDLLYPEPTLPFACTLVPTLALLVGRLRPATW